MSESGNSGTYNTYTTYNVTFMQPSSGLGIDSTRIVTATRGESADPQLGIEIGDTLIEAGGTDVCQMELQEFLEMYKPLPRPLAVVFSRTKQLVLTDNASTDPSFRILTRGLAAKLNSQFGFYNKRKLGNGKKGPTRVL